MRKALVAVIITLFATAAIAGPNTVLGWWRLGEADPGAVVGGPGNATTIDSSGNTNNLNLVGTPAPIYTNLTPFGSTLGMIFGGTSGYIGSAIGTATNNWGVEIWAYATSTTAGTHALIYNGNTSTQGYGIYQVGGSWALLYGGVILTNVAPVTTNQWTDLALVRDSGAATLYVNGVAYPTTSAAPHAVGANMMIGINQGGTEQFVGRLDEGKLFTFTSPFSPSTLAYSATESVPALSAWGLAITAILLMGSFAVMLLLKPRAS